MPPAALREREATEAAAGDGLRRVAAALVHDDDALVGPGQGGEAAPDAELVVAGDHTGADGGRHFLRRSTEKIPLIRSISIS